jgi:regulatory protein
MAGKITGLSAQKRTADRVNVYLDGQFAFGLPAIHAARLKVGQQLSDGEIEQLQATDLVERVYDRSVRFLSTVPGAKPKCAAIWRRRGMSPRSLT